MCGEWTESAQELALQRSWSSALSGTWRPMTNEWDALELIWRAYQHCSGRRIHVELAFGKIMEQQSRLGFFWRSCYAV